MNTPNIHKTYISRGFTLVEIIVSLGLFSVVVVVALGALLSISDANRRVQKTRAVMDNVNLAMESMGRNIKLGRTYHCDTTVLGTPSAVAADCSTGGIYLSFEDQYGSSTLSTDQAVYYYDSVNKKIMYKAYDSSYAVALTSGDVTVNSLKFYVTGTTLKSQPKVHIVLSAVANVGPNMNPVEIDVQTLVSQRELNY